MYALSIELLFVSSSISLFHALCHKYTDSLLCVSFQQPVFLEKFAIQELTKADITDESALEFQVYSSHHMTRRHLVGMASIFLKDVEKFENGLAELVILPHSVYRVRPCRKFKMKETF